MTTGEYQGEFLTFSTPTQLFSILPPKRWKLITTLQALGPLSLRGLARAVGRDVKRVHGDMAVLLSEGLVERNEEDKLYVPFDVIHFRAELIAPKAA
jgi:predicted transcriptional regulator